MLQVAELILILMSLILFIPAYILFFDKTTAWKIHCQELNFLGIPTLRNHPTPNWEMMTDIMGAICVFMAAWMLGTALLPIV